MCILCICEHKHTHTCVSHIYAILTSSHDIMLHIICVNMSSFMFSFYILVPVRIPSDIFYPI